MRECFRCKITFHLDDRLRCLYCDTILTETNNDQADLDKPSDSGIMDSVSQPVIQKVIHDHGVEAHTRLQFIVSSYFRTRTLHFMYAFSRNDFKMGPEFKRELIQSFHVTSLLMLPWILLNLLDSFFCRFLYTKYCSKCEWKFYKTQPGCMEHEHEECEYNREYKEVVDSILDGSIMQSESTFKQLGMMKRNAGRRSAYWDLCFGKEFFSSLLDVVCIWFSICIWTMLIVALFFPAVIRGVYLLEL